MSIDDEIAKEYEKIKSEKIINESIVDNTKRQFADYLRQSNINEEVKLNKTYNNPQKIKIPLKVRFNNFLKKIRYTLWN